MSRQEKRESIKGPLGMTSSRDVGDFIRYNLRTGMDASLYFECIEHLRQLREREDRQRKQHRDMERITPADLQPPVGRPRGRMTRR